MGVPPKIGRLTIYGGDLTGMVLKVRTRLTEPPHDKTSKTAYTLSEDLDQPGHLPILIRVFAVCMKKDWVLRYPLSAQQRL